ncbi:MAG TPA: hemolysin family protein [Candidatus Mucispirillum faecigallinarum]|uniref:Hemolysin family protein n=1 Tax=Candidatus Mucispirillum faecigallinarum TaxID=2838699 RepID=A0A9D2GSV2_9BACT|nr:hemolysin family protein [Candidatus Mucispirillum faecigallinarum]
MDINIWWEVSLLVVSLILAAYFSSMETAVSYLSEVKTKQLFSDEDEGEDNLSKWVTQRNKVLNTIFLGNTLFNIINVFLIIDIVSRYITAHSLLISAVFTFILVLMFGETIPKTLARYEVINVSIGNIKFLNKFYYIFSPIIFISDIITAFSLKLFGKSLKKDPKFSEDELEFLINVGEKEGKLQHDKGEMITNIFDISDIDVKEIMVPRTDITAVPENISTEEIKRIVRETEFSRIPVYRNSLDNIIGILYVKDLIRLKGTDYSIEDLLKLLRKPLFVPETKKIDLMLKEFQKNKLHIAVVVDEYGGTAGIITMEDILEEIVGDILDEYDIDSEEIKQISENKYLINGRMTVSDFCDHFNIEEFNEDDDYDTIAGLVFDLAGEVPKICDEFTWNNFKFTVKRLENRRIALMEVEVLEDKSISEQQEVGNE